MSHGGRYGPYGGMSHGGRHGPSNDLNDLNNSDGGKYGHSSVRKTETSNTNATISNFGCVQANFENVTNIGSIQVNELQNILRQPGGIRELTVPELLTNHKQSLILNSRLKFRIILCKKHLNYEVNIKI